MTNLIPPHDPDAEQAIASAVLIGSVSAQDISAIARPEAFFNPLTREVVAAAEYLEASGQRVDVTTVLGRLRATEKLGAVGGAQALSELMNAPAVGNLREYATTVAQHYQRRQLIDACRIIVAEAYGAIDDQREWLSRVESVVLGVTTSDASDDGVVTVGQALLSLAADLKLRTEGKSPCVAWTGIGPVDAHMRGGMRAGNSYVVAGRPGMGKTALALRVAIETAKRRRAAVFISLEMPTSPEMVARVASLETGEKNAVIDSASPGSEAFNAVALAQSRIGKIPLVFRDKPGATPGQVRAIARKVFAKYRQQGIEPGAIIVDYLQLMHSHTERGATRERQVASCSMALKEIAKELGCAVVVLSQLNRSVDDRSHSDHRPQLSDLRESGAIEQDADAVMFPFRPSRYDKTLEADTEDAEIIFAKFRGGCEGIVNVCWRGECMAYLGRECDQILDDLNDSFDERYG